MAREAWAEGPGAQNVPQPGGVSAAREDEQLLAPREEDRQAREVLLDGGLVDARLVEPQQRPLLREVCAIGVVLGHHRRLLAPLIEPIVLGAARVRPAVRHEGGDVAELRGDRHRMERRVGFVVLEHLARQTEERPRTEVFAGGGERLGGRRLRVDEGGDRRGLLLLVVRLADRAERAHHPPAHCRRHDEREQVEGDAAPQEPRLLGSRTIFVEGDDDPEAHGHRDEHPAEE